MIFPNKLAPKEIKYGLVYLAVSLLVLPSILSLFPLRDGQTNFIYYCVNFAAVILILRRFLWQEVQTALDRPFPTLYYGILGYLGYEALTQLVTVLIFLVFPAFANVNDQGILVMFREDPYLMAIGTIVLVPVAEECFFRGLVFRGLYDRNQTLAYVASMAAFALIHVAGYIGTCSPVQLLLCFVQYLPAGYCLCFAYRRSGTILSPILVHAIVNALGVYNTVR